MRRSAVGRISSALAIAACLSLAGCAAIVEHRTTVSVGAPTLRVDTASLAPETRVVASRGLQYVDLLVTRVDRCADTRVSTQPQEGHVERTTDPKAWTALPWGAGLGVAAAGLYLAPICQDDSVRCRVGQIGISGLLITGAAGLFVAAIADAVHSIDLIEPTEPEITRNKEPPYDCAAPKPYAGAAVALLAIGAGRPAERIGATDPTGALAVPLAAVVLLAQDAPRIAVVVAGAAAVGELDAQAEHDEHCSGVAGRALAGDSLADLDAAWRKCARSSSGERLKSAYFEAAWARTSSKSRLTDYVSLCRVRGPGPHCADAQTRLDDLLRTERQVRCLVRFGADELCGKVLDHAFGPTLGAFSCSASLDYLNGERIDWEGAIKAGAISGVIAAGKKSKSGLWQGAAWVADLYLKSRAAKECLDE